MIGPVLEAQRRAVAVLLLLDVGGLAAQLGDHRADRRQFGLAGADRFGRQPAHRGVSGGLPSWISRLATLTWEVTPLTQLTVATTIGLLGMIGLMAVTVPLAKGPLLVGASGPLTMAIDCRKVRVKRTVSPICRGALTLLA